MRLISRQIVIETARRENTQTNPAPEGQARMLSEIHNDITRTTDDDSRKTEISPD